MLAGAKMNTDDKDLIDLLVCVSQNLVSECMLDNCHFCPRKEFLLQLLRDEPDDLPDDVTFM